MGPGRTPPKFGVFGFHSPHPLIALGMLKLGGLGPPLAWNA